GAEEGCEQSLRIGRQSYTFVAHRDSHQVRMKLCFKMQPPGPRPIRGHGIGRIDNQVEEELLELHAIPIDMRQNCRQLTGYHYTSSNKIAIRKLQHLINDFVQ